jgi:hypothetical protein
MSEVKTTQSLPAVADSRQPCPDPGAFQRLLNATISTDPESFKHDPATCWWCQRGLKSATYFSGVRPPRLPWINPKTLRIGPVILNPRGIEIIEALLDEAARRAVDADLTPEQRERYRRNAEVRRRLDGNMDRWSVKE